MSSNNNYTTTTTTKQQQDNTTNDNDNIIDREFYSDYKDQQESSDFIKYWNDNATEIDVKKSSWMRNNNNNYKGQDEQTWERAISNRGSNSNTRNILTSNNDNDEDNNKIQLIVRATKPSFLAAHKWTLNTSSNHHTLTMDVVRDRSSDIAKAAEHGSNAIKIWRDDTSKNKMRQKFWELGGSQMGKIIGDTSNTQFMGKLDDDDYNQQQQQRNKNKSPTATIISGNPETSTTLPKSSQTNQDLPITRVLSNLLQTVAENQIVIVVGETGSGKTTRLPIALWKDLKLNRGGTGIVGCTQPRRVAAMSVAVRVAEEYGCEIGQEIGYAIRFEDKTSPKTRVKYMTDGVLLRESLRDSELEKYSCIVMDEAHERSLNTDVLFGVLKSVVRSRQDFRLIVTSATLDADRFAQYFGGAEIFRIPGRTFKVEVYFSKTPIADYVEAAVKKIIEIHLTHPPGDILVFMTGQEDITATCELVAERLGKILDKNDNDASEESKAKEKLKENALILLPMYSTLPGDLQARIFQPAPPGQRKCVVSTNVAETSLTVDGIKYVIDSGFAKTNVFNPRVGMDLLRLVPISQAAANQRAGRAGRTAEGYCFRLYTDVQFHHELLPTTVPEIQRTNLASVVLLLKSLGTNNPLDFDFMDPPPLENLIDSMHHLWMLSALDDEGNLTPMGRRMNEFPLEPALSKMLILAHELHCTSEIVTVVSMLSVPEIFFRPPDRQQESDTARERFVVPESDHLTLLNTFGQWQRNNKSATWCAQYFIHSKAMKRALEVREQLVDSMIKERIAEISIGPTGWDKVRMCVCSAYFMNSARMKGIGQYSNMLNGIPVFLHPSSALFGLGFTPDYVVYHELVLTTKEYMRNVTAMEGEWLTMYGPMFFSVRGQQQQQQQQQQSTQSTQSSNTSSNQNPTSTTTTTFGIKKRSMPTTNTSSNNKNDSDSEDDVLASAREKRAKRSGGNVVGGMLSR
jgi:pre-mRNA-splicing factor ATP-dependent RNA helicase DHX38/PRP16